MRKGRKCPFLDTFQYVQESIRKKSSSLIWWLKSDGETQLKIPLPDKNMKYYLFLQYK